MFDKTFFSETRSLFYQLEWFSKSPQVGLDYRIKRLLSRYQIKFISVAPIVWYRFLK